ncbi:MAG: acetyltransferase [Lentisphaerae bacterium]|nr:acetyltransferase [Lentisphaerota bacterium]
MTDTSPTNAPRLPPPHAERIRQACLEAALQAYEDAGISGLCAEGRWECAVQAIRSLDLRAVSQPPPAPPAAPAP